MDSIIASEIVRAAYRAAPHRHISFGKRIADVLESRPYRLSQVSMRARSLHDEREGESPSNEAIWNSERLEPPASFLAGGSVQDRSSGSNWVGKAHGDRRPLHRSSGFAHHEIALHAEPHEPDREAEMEVPPAVNRQRSVIEIRHDGFKDK